MVPMKIQSFLSEEAKPKWEAIRDYLLSQIKEGVYSPGTPIPSENFLAGVTGFARNTIRQAISELEREGLLVKIQGKGTFVSGGKERVIEQSDVNDLSLYGVVVPQIGYNTYSILAKGFDQCANKYHHQMVICDSTNNIHKQGDIIFQLLENGVGGIALVTATSAPTPPHQVRYLQSHGIPVVLCHRHIEGVSAPLISWDSRKVGKIAGTKMLEFGHRNIAYIGLSRYIINECQLAGLREVYMNAGLNINEDNILFGADPTSESIRGVSDEQVISLLSKPDKPTAIFCSDIKEAEKVYILASQNGINIPEDVSLITCGDKGEESYLFNKFSRIEKNEYDLGYKAAEVIQMIKDGQMSITSNDVFTVDLEFTNRFTLSKC